jgi:hypothetical protein
MAFQEKADPPSEKRVKYIIESDNIYDIGYRIDNVSFLM